MKDVKDWSLSTKVFQMIVRAYGTPDVDLMASTLSRKSPFFYSWNRRDLEVLALDSLSRDIMWNAWTGLYLLLQFRDSYSWNVQESFPLDRACPEVLDLAS